MMRFSKTTAVSPTTNLRPLLALLMVAAVVRGADDQVTSSGAGAMSALIDDLGDDFKRLDWAREAKSIEKMLERTWARNGWTDESDRFAMELARDISAIPPWEFMNRLNLASSRVAERYELTPQGAERLKGLALREVTASMLKNRRVILRQMSELLELRKENKPFTPEIVASWMKDAEPLAEEFEAIVERMAEELQRLTPAQRKDVLRADLDGYRKRQAFVDEMMSRWERGEWHPSDWGLEDDPLYVDMVNAPGPRVVRNDRPPRTGSMASANPAAALPKWVAHDPPTWFAYVLEFRSKYKLDAGQFTTARSVHDELLLRATDYMKARKAELDAVAKAEREENELYAPICGLFAELRQRLDAIPTTTQKSEVQKP